MAARPATCKTTQATTPAALNAVVGKRQQRSTVASVPERDYRPRSLLPAAPLPLECALPLEAPVILPVTPVVADVPEVPALEPLPSDYAAQMQAYLRHAHLASLFAKPNSEWYFGVSRLLVCDAPTEDDTKHMKQLARASALFDQFCIGMTVDPVRNRLYVAFRLIDRAEKAMLPSVDHVSQVVGQLAQNSRASTLYAYIEHEDGTVTCCYFGAPSQTFIGDADVPTCEALLDGYPDGQVLAFKYNAYACRHAADEAALLESIGVWVDEERVTGHSLSRPYRETPLNDLSSNVGHYYRALQTNGFVPFLSNTEREKRRSANKAKRAQSKKARRK